MPPPDWVRFAHQDGHTTGVPDWSQTGRRRTSWWEFKHLDLASIAKWNEVLGIGTRQHLNMRRLEVVGHVARYVIWKETASCGSDGPMFQTLIVRPRDLESLRPEAISAGYDMEFVARFMRRVHE